MCKSLIAERITVLLSEQNANITLRVFKRTCILEKGPVCWQGYSAQLKDKPEIMKKYLGV